MSDLCGTYTTGGMTTADAPTIERLQRLMADFRAEHPAPPREYTDAAGRVSIRILDWGGFGRPTLVLARTPEIGRRLEVEAAARGHAVECVGLIDPSAAPSPTGTPPC